MNPISYPIMLYPENTFKLNSITGYILLPYYSKKSLSLSIGYGIGKLLKIEKSNSSKFLYYSDRK